MGHHCGCFVCEECKCLSSSHINGTLENRLCPKCAEKEKAENATTTEEESEEESEESSEEEETTTKAEAGTESVNKKRKI